MRTILPQRRDCDTFDVTFGTTFKVTIGYYEDHVTPGEVFITGAKSGADLEGVARDGAILLSLAIQHGVPIATIAAAMTRNQDGSPMTLLGAVVDKIAASGIGSRPTRKATEEEEQPT